MHVSCDLVCHFFLGALLGKVLILMGSNHPVTKSLFPPCATGKRVACADSKWLASARGGYATLNGTGYYWMQVQAIRADV